MLTRKKLERFVKTRNESAFSSNLQFQIDANACGFSVDDLGPVRKFRIDDSLTGYEWTPSLRGGEKARLVEFGPVLFLEGFRWKGLIIPAKDGRQERDLSAEMFALMGKAVFEEAVDA